MRPGRLRLALWLVAGAAGVAGAALAGEVRLELLPDGTRILHNRGGSPARSAARSAAAYSRRPGAATAPELWAAAVRRHARASDLDPRLVDAVIQAESAYNPAAVSRKGAIGLMQLMPQTARELRVDDPFDPEQNLRGGTTYLRRMLDEFGDVVLALAAYNAGPERVRRFGGVPPIAETRGYVEKVVRLYRGDPGFEVGSARVGRPTYLVRGPDGRMLMTTDPPVRR